MTYDRPEITVLGDASAVVRGKGAGALDNSGPETIAASYELDEE